MCRFLLLRAPLRICLLDDGSLDPNKGNYVLKLSERICVLILSPAEERNKDPNLQFIIWWYVCMLAGGLEIPWLFKLVCEDFLRNGLRPSSITTRLQHSISATWNVTKYSVASVEFRPKTWLPRCKCFDCLQEKSVHHYHSQPFPKINLDSNRSQTYMDAILHNKLFSLRRFISTILSTHVNHSS